MEDSLTTLCGAEAAAWQRAMTTRMMTSTAAFDINCILNAARYVHLFTTRVEMLVLFSVVFVFLSMWGVCVSQRNAVTFEPFEVSS